MTKTVFTAPSIHAMKEARRTVPAKVEEAVTEPKPADVFANVLNTYRSRLAAIEARHVPVLNYVLSWGDGRFVRLERTGDGQKAHVTGFENATFFGDRAAAVIWLKRGLTDGARIAPAVLPAFNAKQGAIITLQRVIDMVEAQQLLHIEEPAQLQPATPVAKSLDEDELRQIARRFMDAQGFRSSQTATACVTGFLAGYRGVDPKPYGGKLTVAAYRTGYAAGQEA